MEGTDKLASGIASYSDLSERLASLESTVVGLTMRIAALERWTTDAHVVTEESVKTDPIAALAARVNVLEQRIPKPPKPEDPSLSAAKAGEMLGMDSAGVIAMIRAKVLPARKGAGRAGYHIRQSDVLVLKERLGK